jgi:hypothetical protein
VPEQELTVAQRALVATWEQLMAAEFASRSSKRRWPVREFYTRYFIGKHPPDVTIVPLTRTVGDTRIVDDRSLQMP